MSLDTLAADDRPQSQPVLILLSCYAPATPIPMGLLQVELLDDLLGRRRARRLLVTRRLTSSTTRPATSPYIAVATLVISRSMSPGWSRWRPGVAPECTEPPTLSDCP
jgi:hypothetical protein